ncbi:MAG: GDSL-type esterase/lipase family protein [Candidatus Zhuqueibacterota bacterium]
MFTISFTHSISFRRFFSRIQLWIVLTALLPGCHTGADIYPEHLLAHRAKRIAQFKQENAHLSAPKTIILLGDSITEGFDAARYFPSLPILNRGIVADHTGIEGSGVLQRLDESIYQCRPRAVFLMIGVNDLADKKYRPRQIAAGAEKIIQKIHRFDPSIAVYLQSALPATGKYAHLNSLIVEYNRRLILIAAETHVEFIDLHAQFVDDSGQLKAEYSRDGIHLTDAGYDAWKQIVLPLLQQVLQ